MSRPWEKADRRREQDAARCMADRLAEVEDEERDAANLCAAEENGMSRCDEDHLARGVACEDCARRAGRAE